MKTGIRMTCLTLLFLSSLALANGQLPRYQRQEETIRVGINLVTVNVIVTDSKGRYVKGLQADQFSVYDEKVKQSIVHFAAGSAPVSVGIVCEIQTGRPERASAILAALKQFVATLGPRDEFFLVAYSQQGSLTTDFIPTAEQLLNHLTFVKPGGASALYDATFLAASRLRQARNLKKVLLVISDGQDQSSRHTYNELRNRLREFDAQIYAISIADPSIDEFAGYDRWIFEDFTRQTGRRSFLLNSDAAMGRAVLAEMARVSGGSTYSPESESEPELAAICTQIAVEMREQYTLAFYPSQLDSRKWHRLKVRIESTQDRSDLKLFYREGYQIPGNKLL